MVALALNSTDWVDERCWESSTDGPDTLDFDKEPFEETSREEDPNLERESVVRGAEMIIEPALAVLGIRTELERESLGRDFNEASRVRAYGELPAEPSRTEIVMGW